MGEGLSCAQVVGRCSDNSVPVLCQSCASNVQHSTSFRRLLGQWQRSARPHFVGERAGNVGPALSPHWANAVVAPERGRMECTKTEQNRTNPRRRAVGTRTPSCKARALLVTRLHPLPCLVGTLHMCAVMPPMRKPELVRRYLGCAQCHLLSWAMLRRQRVLLKCPWLIALCGPMPSACAQLRIQCVSAFGFSFVVGVVLARADSKRHTHTHMQDMSPLASGANRCAAWQRYHDGFTLCFPVAGDMLGICAFGIAGARPIDQKGLALARCGIPLHCPWAIVEATRPHLPTAKPQQPPLDCTTMGRSHPEVVRLAHRRARSVADGGSRQVEAEQN